MNKQEFRHKLDVTVKNPNMIPGIYNYCDRWCERCVFTARCTNYQLHSPNEKDESPEEFWENMAMIFEATKDMLGKGAKERGINLDEIEFTKEDKQGFEERDQSARKSAGVLLARKYFKLAQPWLDHLDKKEPVGLEVRMQNAEVKNCFEIIHWYLLFIEPKLFRASLSQQDENEDKSEAHDSLGSAKVALIAIDRSVGAWSVVLQKFTEDEEVILQILICLQKLRNEVEKQFPCARNFIRPGLDK